MVVDRCESAVIEENENTQSSSEDRRPCESEQMTPGPNKYVNVHTPLQLGGRAKKDLTYPRNVQDQGFTGCIKNVIHNGEVSVTKTSLCQGIHYIRTYIKNLIH